MKHYLYMQCNTLKQELELITSMMSVVTNMMECDSLQHKTESKMHFLLYPNLQEMFTQLSSLVDIVCSNCAS